MAAPTSLSAFVDLFEYSRFESDKKTITVTVMPTGIGTAGEQVTVSIVKARRNRDIEVAHKTLTLTGATADIITFYIPDIIDGQHEYPKMRRGSYFIRVTSVTNPLIVGESTDFLVSIITVDGLRKGYLHGATLRAFLEVFGIHNQPSLITGIIVDSLSTTHPLGWFPLTYNYNDNGIIIVRTISWACGPEIVITPGKTRYTLQRSNGSDYIDIIIPSIAGLPTSSLSENLLVERAPLSDEKIREIINRAISWVEDDVLAVYLEPTRIATEFDTNVVQTTSQNSVPLLINYDVDKVVDAITYYRPATGHWMNIRFPYYPVITVETMYGKIANTRIINVALEWLEIHHGQGFIELVPFNQETAFNFLGLIWVESLRGNIPLPNFWNHVSIVGFKELPPVIIELIAKKAVIDILTIAGLGYRFGSTSLSRDGVSESISYTSMARYGIYNAAIGVYKEWIDEEIIRLRGAFRGPCLQTV